MYDVSSFCIDGGISLLERKRRRVKQKTIGFQCGRNDFMPKINLPIEKLGYINISSSYTIFYLVEYFLLLISLN